MQYIAGTTTNNKRSQGIILAFMEAILSKMSINCSRPTRESRDRDLEVGLDDMDNMRTDKPRDQSFNYFADVMMPMSLPLPVTPPHSIHIRVDPCAPRKSQQQVWAHANARRSKEQLCDGDDVVSGGHGLPVKRRLF